MTSRASPRKRVWRPYPSNKDQVPCGHERFANNGAALSGARDGLEVRGPVRSIANWATSSGKTAQHYRCLLPRSRARQR